MIFNPTGKLHIKQNSSGNSPHLRLTEIGNDYTRIKLESDEHPLSFWDIAGKADKLTEFSHINFYFQNETDAGNRLTLRGNGNIGINNTSPQSKLDINNVGDGAELLRLSTERPWVFKQTGSAIVSKLTLQSTTGDKIFNIVSPDGTKVSASFKASDTNPLAYLVPVEGKLGIGTYNPTTRATIIGSPTLAENILRIESTYLGNNNIAGIDCKTFPAVGYGVGANFYGGHRGLRGIAEGQTFTGLSIGVVAGAIGVNNSGTRTALHANAYGGLINWAGYFDNGNVYVRNDLRIGSGAIAGAAGYKVAIDGKVIAEELRINLSQAWPDYVFDASYDLMSLDQLESCIKKNNHLPGIPSANEVQKNGLIVGEMQSKMMEKIEELTLYILELNKDLIQVKKELEQVKSQRERDGEGPHK